MPTLAAQPTPLPPPPATLRAEATAAPLPPPAHGLLQILVRPWAEVTVDGAPAGTTPFKPLKLAAGSHTIVFSHPDYKPFQRKVSVPPGQTVRLEIDLSWEAFKKER